MEGLDPPLLALKLEEAGPKPRKVGGPEKLKTASKEAENSRL